MTKKIKPNRKNTKKNNKIDIPKTNLDVGISSIDTKNIKITDSGLSSKSFEEFLEMFGDDKNNTTDMLSRSMSQNNTKINLLGNLKIDINNILKYQQSEGLSNKTQQVIVNLFLKKLQYTGLFNEKFKDSFELIFGNKTNTKNKKALFIDLQINIDSLITDFPDIVKNITISNIEIFEGLNKLGSNINQITNFNSQQPSDKKILSELLYFEIKTPIENIKSTKDGLDNDLKLLFNQGISPVDAIQDYISDMQSSNTNKINSDLKLLEAENEQNYKNKNKLDDDFEKTGYKDKNILNDIHQTNKQIWKDHIKFFDTQDSVNKNDNNKGFLDVLKKLVNNNFNFEKISNSEQAIFINKTISNNIDALTKNQWTNSLGINNEEYKKFLTQLMGFDKKEENLYITLPNSKEINFKVTKSFQGGEHLNLLDYDNFNNTNNLPIIYDIEFNGDDETIIELNKILRNEKDIDLKNKNIDDLKKIRLNGSEINKLNKLYMAISIQPKEYKDIDEEKIQEELNDIENTFDKNNIESNLENEGSKKAEKFFEEIENTYIHDDDLYDEIYDDVDSIYNKLNNNGKKSFKQKLIELADESHDDEIKGTVDDIINHIDNSINNDEGFDTPTKITEKLTNNQKFMKAWDDLPGNNFKGIENNGFIKGTRLMINIGGSVLPPEDQSDSFFEIEIIDAPKTGDSFKVKIIGNEIKGTMEGQIMDFPKTDDQLSLMQSSGEIFKLAAGEPKDWGKSIKNINSSKIIKRMSVFGTGDGEIEMKNGKFINNKGEEINHFCRSNDEYSGELDSSGEKAQGQIKNYTTYKIKKIDKSKGTVRVSCNFEGQDQNNLAKNINYKYDKELSYEQFILLMESKKTRGYTKEQKNEIFGIKGPSRLPAKGLFRFVTMKAIVGAFKNGAKNIKDNLTKVSEDELSDIENLLYSEEGLNLYGKIGNIFGSIGFSGTSEAFLSAKMDYYNDREGRTWKKIEKYYQKFEADPHFPSLWFTKLKPLLETPGYVGNDKNRYQVAAAFLTLMKKDGPYGRGQGLAAMGQGFWIEKFLGAKHKKRFKTFFEERKKQLEENKDDDNPDRSDQKQDELVRLEFDYMSGIMDGRNPFGGYQGDGEDARASVWSREFVKKLDDNSKSYFGDYTKKADDWKGKSFRQAEQEAYRMAGAGRLSKALPPLRQMVNAMESSSEKNRVKMTILSFMLTGVIKNGQDSSVMRDFEEISRTIGLLPGMWARKIDQQDKIQKLLDGITNPDILGKDGKPAFGNENFSTVTGYKKSDFELGSFNPKQNKLKFITTTFPSYWNKYGDKILDILEFRDLDSENSMITLANQGGADSDVYEDIIQFSRENIRGGVSKNLRYTAPWTANKGIVSQLIPQKGRYKGTERIDMLMAQNFWKMVNKEFNTQKLDKRGSVEFYLGKYFNWFDEGVLDQTSKNFIARGLPLIKSLKAAGHEKEAKYQLWYLIKGNLHKILGSFPSEFGTTIDKFQDFFWNNIELIDKDMIKNTIGEEEAQEFDNPYGMLPWDNFTTHYMNIESGSTKEKREYIQRYKPFESNYINWEIDKMKKRISNAGVSGLKNPPDESGVRVEHKEGYERIITKAA